MTALPSKLGARRRRRRIFLAVAVPLLILSLFGGLVALSRWSGITISTIEVEGASAVPEEELIASTEWALRGNYLWLFPKGNIFLYPRRVAEQALRREFPTLRSADLSFVNLHTLLFPLKSGSSMRSGAAWMLRARRVCIPPQTSACFSTKKGSFSRRKPISRERSICVTTAAATARSAPPYCRRKSSNSFSHSCANFPHFPLPRSQSCFCRRKM